jgi:ABC-type lipoprotein release transport system permease subunit
MSSLLYKTGAFDLATFFVASFTFLAIALLASYLPAKRAAAVNPLEILR